MTTDRELLELAAKAAGYKVIAGRVCGLEGQLNHPGDGGLLCDNGLYWNPLTDDGDALRLAVKLHMTVRCYMGTTTAQIGTPGLKNAYEEDTNHADPAAATRRAIVRAAAACAQSNEPFPSAQEIHRFANTEPKDQA